jgi:hypothetical protein
VNFVISLRYLSYLVIAYTHLLLSLSITKIILYSISSPLILIMYSISLVISMSHRTLIIRYLSFLISTIIALSLYQAQMHNLGIYPSLIVNLSFAFLMVNMQLFTYPMLINMISTLHSNLKSFFRILHFVVLMT